MFYITQEVSGLFLEESEHNESVEKVQFGYFPTCDDLFSLMANLWEMTFPTFS